MKNNSILESNSSDLKRYLLKVWYIGSYFSGSQRQPDKRTVEGELLKALKKTKYISEAQISSFKAAARTDSGVHAREAAFCFNSSYKIYIQQIETFLPVDLGIIGCEEVDLDFHPRWEVEMKVYKCIYVLKEEENPSMKLMNEALKFYEGDHDFRLFSKTDYSKKNKLTKLTVNKASVTNCNAGNRILVFSFQSKSFLWQQIRRTISFILKIGKGEANFDDLKKKLDPEFFNEPSLNRDKPIEPGGLILWKLKFPGNKQFNFEKRSLKKQQEFIKELERKLNQKRNSLLLFLKEK
jgi:tRNA pseudouridine38-40 synthase